MRAFGATGDGTTDDTAAFTQALASLNEGGTLAVPPGTYRIEPGALTIPGNTAVVGDRATMKPFGTGFDLIELPGNRRRHDGRDDRWREPRRPRCDHRRRREECPGSPATPSRTSRCLRTPPTRTTSQTPAGIRIEGNGDTITIEGVTVKNVVANHANDTATAIDLGGARHLDHSRVRADDEYTHHDS